MFQQFQIKFTLQVRDGFPAQTPPALTLVANDNLLVQLGEIVCCCWSQMRFQVPPLQLDGSAVLTGVQRGGQLLSLESADLAEHARVRRCSLLLPAHCPVENPSLGK